MNGRSLSDSVVGELLTPPDEGESILFFWSHHALSDTPDATLGRCELDDLTPPEVNTRTVLLTNEPHHDSADYIVTDRLGMGGMGVVVEAEQVYFKRRRVALKMIRPELAPDPHAVRAFFREAVITSTMDHPGIVPILDFGVSQDGRAFYAMKKAGGTPWSRVICDKPLDDNLDVLDRVADVVAYAHSQGILHRDLKPANVMLGEFGEVWLGDWGVALRRNAGGGFSHACPGGTPQYMPPEAAACRFGELGERSDVYSLGAILFEILNGYPPHLGDTPAECLVNAAENIMRESKSNDALADVAKQAMETMPHRRYASVADFQKALRTCRTGRRSSALIKEGMETLSRAKDSGDYDLFTRAIATFDNALAIDPQSINARSKRTKAIFAYFKAARAKGEYDLAASVLQGLPGNRQAAELLLDNHALKKRAAKRKRNSRAAALGGGVVLLLGICLAGVYYYLRNPAPHESTPEYQATMERMNAVNSEQSLLATTCYLLKQFDSMIVNRQAYLGPLADSEPARRLVELSKVWENYLYHPNPDNSTNHELCRRAVGTSGELRQIYTELKEQLEAGNLLSDTRVDPFLDSMEKTLIHLDEYAKRFMAGAEND